MNFYPTQEYALDYAIKQLARLTGQTNAETRKGVLEVAARNQCRSNPGFRNLGDGTIKRSARTIVTAHSCLKCGSIYMERPVNDDGFAKRLADGCCSPYECETCGKAFEGTTRWLHCPDCASTKTRAQWEKLPYADETPGAMLYAAGLEQWFYSLHDFLDHCWADELEDPNALLPVWGELDIPSAPDLADSMSQDAPEDYDFSFLRPIQKELNALIEAECRWYSPGKTRPQIPEDWKKEFEDDENAATVDSEA